MKKFIFKMFVGGLVFFGTGFLLFFLVKARTGTISSPGDKLTASKRNEMIANMSGMQTQLTTIQSKFSGENRIVPTLQNSWVNYGVPYNTAGYMKDGFGFVHLKGLVKSGTNSIIFTLPSGYRPIQNNILTQYSVYSGARVDVFADGTVRNINGSNTRVSLDGIIFKAE